MRTERFKHWRRWIEIGVAFFSRTTLVILPRRSQAITAKLNAAYGDKPFPIDPALVSAQIEMLRRTE